MPLLPFSDAAFSEVLARVAYRLIEYDYRHNHDLYARPRSGLSSLSDRLYAGGFHSMAFWVAAYSMGIARGDSTKETRRLMIQRSRAGCTWRSVAYNPYKVARRGDPRVTNRGVMGQDQEEGQQ